MNNLKKRRTSVLIGLALMGLSVHAYAVDVTATTDTPTTVASAEANGASESHVINVTANRMASFRFRYAGSDGCYYGQRYHE